MLHHGQLYRVLGQAREGNGVKEYLGLKYATLKNQFAPAVLCDHYAKDPSNHIDATSFGPDLSGASACAFEQSLIQHKLSRYRNDTTSQEATDCLTLNIWAPETSNNACCLPVLVYIHGGGLKNGSANWPQNHLANLVKHSVATGAPVIAVSINYRQGILGFLTSKEMRSRGYLGNNGLRDQRVALKWIKKYIRGFNGDENNITVLGHSAGAVSVTLHLASEEPLFNRAIAMSGSHMAVRPASEAAHEAIYAQTAKVLGIDGLSPDDRISALERIPGPELMAVPPFIPFAPVIDGEICHQLPTYATIAQRPPTKLNQGWCKDICVGYCGFDASIVSLGLAHRKSNIRSDFILALQRESIDPSPILQAYGISSNSAESQEFIESDYIGVLNFCQEVMFQAPAIAIARHWYNGSAFVYNFNEPNPWDGPWKGRASHIFDIALLSQNFNHYLSKPLKGLAERFASEILHFVHAKSPWQPFEGENTCVRTYRLSEYAEMGVSVDRDIYNKPIWGFVQDYGADTLLNAVEEFLRGIP